jgi:hypothetical protein
MTFLPAENCGRMRTAEAAFRVFKKRTDSEHLKNGCSHSASRSTGWGGERGETSFNENRLINGKGAVHVRGGRGKKTSCNK